MRNGDVTIFSGQRLDETYELSLAELCRVCGLPAERVIELVDQGVLEPSGRDPAQWRFRGTSVQHVYCVLRLQRDLGVNTAGAALALDLLQEIKLLRARLRRI
jgi:chaperone modulatory protein CbpM